MLEKRCTFSTSERHKEFTANQNPCHLFNFLQILIFNIRTVKVYSPVYNIIKNNVLKVFLHSISRVAEWKSETTDNMAFLFICRKDFFLELYFTSIVPHSVEVAGKIVDAKMVDVSELNKGLD